VVHEEGYQVDRQPDGALRFRRPDGRLIPEVLPPPAVPADPVEALRAQHDAQGLRLHARTACPSWLGERLDVTYAIDVLHPLANRLADSSSREGSTHHDPVGAGRCQRDVDSGLLSIRSRG